MKPSGKPAVLFVGYDRVLNRTRGLIFGQSFEVTVAERLSEAAALLSEQRFALVLLCYSLSDDERRAMVDLVRQGSPETRILVLGEGGERLDLRAQDQVHLSGGPAELLRKAAAMAGVPTLRSE